MFKYLWKSQGYNLGRYLSQTGMPLWLPALSASRTFLATLRSGKWTLSRHIVDKNFSHVNCSNEKGEIVNREIVFFDPSYPYEGILIFVKATVKMIWDGILQIQMFHLKAAFTFSDKLIILDNSFGAKGEKIRQPSGPCPIVHCPPIQYKSGGSDFWKLKGIIRLRITLAVAVETRHYPWLTTRPVDCNNRQN